MKISYNWIKDYLNIDLDPHKVAEILTGIGLEIEGMDEWRFFPQFHQERTSISL